MLGVRGLVGAILYGRPIVRGALLVALSIAKPAWLEEMTDARAGRQRRRT